MDRNSELHAPMKQPPIHIEKKDVFFRAEKNLLPPAPTVGTVLTVLFLLAFVSWGTHFQRLLLLWRYNSDWVLAFSIIPFYLRWSWTCSVHFINFIFFKSFLTSSSQRDLGIPAGLPVNGFHLCILFTMLVSGILFMCPNQLNLWALT